MTEERRDSAAGEQSERQKAPGRVAHIQRVNEERKRRREMGELKDGEQGGRPIEHGEYALVSRYQAGVSTASPLYPILKQHRDGFVADLGGDANASAKELEACEQMAFLAVLHRLQVARFADAKRMSRQEFLELSQAATRTAATFAQIAKQLGFKRQAQDVDRQIIVRRWTQDPAPSGGNGSEQGEGA